MAKIVFSDGDFSVVSFSEQSYEQRESARNDALLVGQRNDYSVELLGEFKVGSSGEPSGGFVDTILLKSRPSANAAKIAITDIHMSAQKAYEYLTNGTFSELLDQVFSKDDKLVGSAENDRSLSGHGGNDRINGNAGSDYIDGGDGNDRMTGGSGTDIFRFYPNSGHDIITDFAADIDAEDRDYFMGDPDDVKAVLKSGHNTIVKFYGGDQVTLLEVKSSDFTVDDYWTG